ncbi:MAG: ankyrin repeat domain-containing protein [Bacteroidota bacterium]
MRQAEQTLREYVLPAHVYSMACFNDYPLLHWIIRQGEAGNPLLAALVEKKINLNLLDKYNQTPLHLAAAYGNVEAVHLLLRAGALADEYDWEYCTPLHRAVIRKHAEVIKVLLDAGVDINKSGPCGNQSALHIAAAQGGLDAIQLLLQRGSDTDLRETVYGMTPIECAIDEGHSEIGKVLEAWQSKRTARAS